MINIFRRNHRDNKGFVIVTALLVSSILLILLIPYISRVVAEHRLVSKMNSSTIAINVAEAGIERVIWEILKRTICYNGSTSSDWTHTGTSTTLQTWTTPSSGVEFKDSGGNIVGYYDASVSLPAGSKIKTITVTAYVPNKTKYDGKKTVTVHYYSEGLFPLSNAIAADGLGLTGKPLNNSIKIDSNVGEIDSYDSSIGPYGGSNIGDQANIVTNGNIQMSAATDHVHGNAYYGGKFAGNDKAVTGIVDKLQAPLEINFPGDLLNAAKPNPTKRTNDNSRITVIDAGTNPAVAGIPWSPLDINNNLVIKKGATIRLTYVRPDDLDFDPDFSNIYYFKSILMGGDGTTNTIQVDAGADGKGAVTIYVDGGKITTSGVTNINKVDFKEGSNPGNPNPLPSSLIMYSNYAGTDNGVSLGDNCDLYGALYAPYAISVVGAMNFYGAIVCKTIHFNGATNLHFDTNLKNTTSSTSNDGPTSWEEQ